MEIDAFGESTMIPRPELYKLIRHGRIAAHRTEIAAFTRDGVILRGGDTLGLDCVVFGTGWKNDYSFLSADARDVLGKKMMTVSIFIVTCSTRTCRTSSSSDARQRT